MDKCLCSGDFLRESSEIPSAEPPLAPSFSSPQPEPSPTHPWLGCPHGMATPQALIPARGHGQQGWDSPLPQEGGNLAAQGSAIHGSLFLPWLNVCFQIPQA